MSGWDYFIYSSVLSSVDDCVDPTEAVVQWSRQAVLQWSRQAVLQWSRQAVLQWSRQAVLQWSRQAVLQWSRQAVLQWSRQELHKLHPVLSFRALFSSSNYFRVSTALLITSSDIRIYLVARLFGIFRLWHTAVSVWLSVQNLARSCERRRGLFVRRYRKFCRPLCWLLYWTVCVVEIEVRRVTKLFDAVSVDCSVDCISGDWLKPTCFFTVSPSPSFELSTLNADLNSDLNLLEMSRHCEMQRWHVS